VEFTSEQRAWLDAIKDHIANSLAIDQDDFQYAPFNQMGGIGKAIQVFGDQLPTVLNDLNERLAA
jgi:type I restriction enzyme R subunit